MTAEQRATIFTLRDRADAMNQWRGEREHGGYCGFLPPAPDGSVFYHGQWHYDDLNGFYRTWFVIEGDGSSVPLYIKLADRGFDLRWLETGR